MPSTLRSDRGKHFTAEVFEELCKLSGIKHKLGSPEHPQSQGQVERQNQLINQVRCLCENDIEKWPETLFSVQYSHNGSINSSTGYTPGRVLLGKGFSNPEDVVLNDLQKKDNSECMSKKMDRRDEDDEEIIRQITERVKRSQQKRTNSQNSRGTPYKVGDRVRYRLNNDTRSKRGGKLAPRYSEEYQVVEVLGDGYTYNLKAVNHKGRDKSRHFNLLKTVQRLGDNSSLNTTTDDQPTVGMDTELGTLDEEILEEDGTQERSDEPERSGESRHNDPSRERWVRRSRRERRPVEMLQADGKKKTYSSSKAVDIEDSE